MSILGIESLVYGVADMATSVRFFRDFGLAVEQEDDAGAVFRLREGSSVVVRGIDDPALPPAYAKGSGPREVIWGVDGERALAAIAADLGRDRAVRRDGDGTLHTSDDAGIPIGFRIFRRKPPEDVAQFENGLGSIKRWNQLRRWYERATPAVMHHIVFFTADIDKAVSFYVERLGFRITDMIRHAGVFMRCDGRHDHHNLFFIKSRDTRFNHVSFGVENIDELMTGANHLQRQGWSSADGLGRHRATSIIFFYADCPAGGRCEYAADSDYLTDAWQPRLWEGEFANYHWLADWNPETAAPEWKMQILPTPLPSFAAASALGTAPAAE